MGIKLGDLITYIPKGTVYKALLRLEAPGYGEVFGYYDIHKNEMYFRLTSDFEKFKTHIVRQSGMHYFEHLINNSPDKKIKSKIKLNGTWHDCLWTPESGTLEIS